MSEQALLKVEHVDGFHGSLQVLWDVSLTVKAREIVAIIGANGSGKTTLLDMISGVIHPKKGRIKFEGTDISVFDPFKIVGLGISHVPEGRRLFPEMTVLENLILGSYNRRARANRDDNLQRVYRLFPQLEERERQLTKTLSGGERQMVAIGRGLMSAPTLMLLDEMSLGLAPFLVTDLYKALQQIRETGITILFVEQNARRSLTEADRAYIMEGGSVALSGSTAQLREDDTVKEAYFGV